MSYDRAAYDSTGIRRRIRRAREQLRLLHPELTRFAEKQRERIVHHVESTRQIWLVEGDNEFVPIDYAIHIGDVLYNLRSALDHTVWQLVIANGQEPDRGNAYPICRDQAAFDIAKGRALKGVSFEAQEAILQYQPWRPSQHGLDLWLLHIMSIHDRHRHLLMAAGYSGGPMIGDVSSLKPDSMVTVSTWLLNKGELLLAVDDPSADIQDNVQFRLVIQALISRITCSSVWKPTSSIQRPMNPFATKCFPPSAVSRSRRSRDTALLCVRSGRRCIPALMR